MTNSAPNKNSRPLRVGLLLCDEVDASARARYGTYAKMFSERLRAVDRDLRLSPIHCYRGELPNSPAEFDAFLISGSRQAVYDPLPWIVQLQDFIRRCQARRKKTVGICFGHQLIAHALGGETRKAEVGWGLGIHRTQITQPQKWMQNGALRAPHSYNLVVLHQDQVVALPPGFTVIAENEFCPISMFVADEVMLGLQGHPEFDKEFCAYRIHSRKPLLDENLYRQSLASLAQMQLDSAQVLGWVARFMRAEGSA